MPPPDVVMNVMRQLVRQDYLDLVVRVLGQQRVGQQNPARPADSRKRSICLSRSVAELPLEYTEDASARPLRQCNEPIGKLATLKWLHRVEERQEQHRRKLSQHHDDHSEARGSNRPPETRAPLQQVADYQGADDGENDADAIRLQPIEPPAGGSFCRQPVPPLQCDALIERERKLSGLAEQREHHDVKDHSDKQRTVCDTGRNVTQRRRSASHHEQHQHDCAERCRRDPGAAAQPVVSSGFVFVHGVEVVVTPTYNL